MAKAKDISPPRCKLGSVIDCAIRGPVPVSRIAPNNGWPQTKLDKQYALIVCGDLLRDLRAASSLEIQAVYGLSRSTVERWRRTLRIDSRKVAGYLSLARGLPARNIPREKVLEGAKRGLKPFPLKPRKGSKIAVLWGRRRKQHPKETQGEMARVAGIARRTLAAYLAGYRQPSESGLAKIANRWGLDYKVNPSDN